MAGAGQPWYMPLTWPVGHVFSAVSKKQDEEVPKPSAVPDLDLIGNLTSFVAATRSFLIAVALIYGLYSGYDYPAFGAAKTLEFSWMRPILLRNLIGTWMICGFWDWFLYFSPLKDKLRKFKLNPKYPSNYQILHDAAVTTLASVCAAAIEICLCYLWATGKLPMQKSIMDAPIWTFCWAITITHWRVPHFHLMHRFMHPWRIDIGFDFVHEGKTLLSLRVPDLGKFLYYHVHSLHHKSYNPTAFSGTNMHPVEATIYYTAAFLPVAFGVHPAISLGCIVDCAVGAWLGHDGFQWPGSGDYFHQLHHSNFDCNYGAMHVPIDKWLGTYAGCREDLKKNWGNKKVGAENNETPVHESKKEKDEDEKEPVRKEKAGSAGKSEGRDQSPAPATVNRGSTE